MKSAMMAVAVGATACALFAAGALALTHGGPSPFHVALLGSRHPATDTILNSAAYRPVVTALRMDFPADYLDLQALAKSDPVTRRYLELSLIRSVIKDHHQYAAAAPDSALLSIAQARLAFLKAMEDSDPAECTAYLQHPGEFFSVGDQEKLDPASTDAYAHLQAAELEGMKLGAQAPVARGEITAAERITLLNAFGPELIAEAKNDPTLKQCRTNTRMLAALLAASPSVAADLLASEYRSDGMFGVE